MERWTLFVGSFLSWSSQGSLRSVAHESECLIVDAMRASVYHISQSTD